jgi:hypothetical protein
MTVPQEQLVREVHAAGLRMVIAVTGGGSGAISALLSVGGASRSVLAATVPYAEAALVEFLGGPPDEFCAPPTARAMAMASFQKAARYDPQANTCGIACTASLASDRPKRGAHRAHLAYQTASTTAEFAIELEKGHRSRAEEEALVAALVLNVIAEACGLTDRLELPLTDREPMHAARIVAPADWQALLAGRKQAVVAGGTAEAPKVVFAGAFNPIHHGHRKMAEVVRSLLGCEVAYEISTINVDKPPLDFIEIDQRLRQFSPSEAVWLTRAAKFVEKAELFPGSTFVVGTDTITRVGDVRYYGGSHEALETAISRIASSGCRFLVFGRVVEGAFRTLADLQIPDSLAHLCQEVPQSLFRDDISSTELRRRRPRA